MKKVQRIVWLTLCIVVLGLFAMPLQASAGNEINGTIGANGGIQWTYDADTKTLTMTGEDVCYYSSSPFKSKCADVEKIVIKDCKIKSTTRNLFRDLDKLVTVEFDNVDTSSVTDMYWMFAECDSLAEVDLRGLDTGNVKDMSCMFWYCSSLTKVNLSGLDTGKVMSMYRMFAGCSSLTQLDLSQLDTGNVTNMESMFSGCGFEEPDLSDLDTGNVTNMRSMFSGCKVKKLDLSSFDTENVTDMDSMFYNCSNLVELDLSSFDTGNVTDLDNMFYNCSSLAELDLSSFDTSNFTYFNDILSGCSSLKKLNLSNFNFNRLADREPSGYLFGILDGCSSLEELIMSNCNTSEVTNMYAMFAGCPNLTSLDLSSFDTGNVTDMSSMFYDASSLEELDLSGFDTGNVTGMSYMFSGCSGLEELDLSNFDTSKVLQANGMFSRCTNLKSLDMSSFDLGEIKNSSSMLANCNALELIKTPKKMKSGEYITLPYIFVDSKGNNTTMIMTGYTGETLKKAVFISEMVLNADNISLENNDEYQLVATVSPDNATNKAVTWESSDTAVATVDASGKVTAVGAGTATITATAADGSGVSASCKVTVTQTMSEQEKQVRAFVERMYTIVLGRAAEAQGLDDWSARLMAKEIDGATLVDMFVNSDEFINRNTSDEEYIKILYRAVLGREADADGLKMWKDMLADDWTRDYILDGLVLSVEFKNICDSYGIIAAFEPTAESQVRSFVKRMYTVVLNRRADVVGLDEWTQRLMNGTANGAQIADGFISSDEFVNRNLSNEKYVKVLYRAFFNREPDEGGFNVWMNELAKGASRREVMKGFVHSVEFSDLCAQYGIIRGEIQ